MSASNGAFHPRSGELDLHVETTLAIDTGASDPIALDLTTAATGGRAVDAAGNLKLVMRTPLSLPRNGNITAAIGVETVSFTFEGTLNARPAP